MPTAPKLVAAIFFAAVGWFCADMIVPALPEGTQSGRLHEALALVGMFSGWMMSGRRAGDGVRAGFGYGLTTSALMVFWGVLIFGTVKMLQSSIDRRYSGPVEALQSLVGICIEYLGLIAIPPVVGSLIIAGLFGGWLTEWAARRWS